MKLSLRRFKYSVFFVAATFAGLIAPMAHARISGEVDLGFTDYNSTVNGQKKDGSSFRQRYMALYSGSGQLEYGRLGTYKYSLGYEWTSFDSRIKAPGETTTTSESTGHLLYEGDLDLRPKYLPFRLKAYSRDMSRASFLDGSTSLLSGDPIITPGITDQILGGTHIRNGLFLSFGLKNDVYSPLYRQFPLITIDYTNEYDKDTKSISPTDARRDNLGIMLTKGDVEVSFWRREYRDKIYPSADYVEDTYTIGTVSYRDGRKFVDLTNWIKISADASFQRSSNGSGAGTSDEYDLNLHGMATRERWELSTFNNFGHSMNRMGSSSNFRIPVFARGIWNTDTSWQVQLTASDNTTKGFSAVNDAKNSDFLASVKVDTFKRSPFTLSPSLSVEQVKDLEKKSTYFVGSVETASNRRFSDRYALYGSYSISLTNSDIFETHSTSSYVQHTLAGRGIYRVSDSLRVELQETLKTASGRNTSSGGVLGEQFNEQRQVPGSQSPVVTSTDGYYQSVTKFTTSWIPTPRMKIGFILTEDILQRDNQDLDILTKAANTVEYSLPSFTVGSTLQMAKRYYGVESTEISGNGSIIYTPDKTMSADIRYNFSRASDPTSSTENIEVTQSFRYSFFSRSGLGRNWLNLREQLSWTKTMYGNVGFPDRPDSKKRLTLGVDWYPTRYVFAWATIRYSLLDPGSVNELFGSTGIGMSFKKIQASIDYSYGKRNGDNDNRVEQRISGNFKKQF